MTKEQQQQILVEGLAQFGWNLRGVTRFIEFAAKSDDFSRRSQAEISVENSLASFLSPR